jgi:hypothetical protein
MKFPTGNRGGVMEKHVCEDNAILVNHWWDDHENGQVYQFECEKCSSTWEHIVTLG